MINKTNKIINRIKGTQDLLDLTLFNFLIDQSKKHLKIYDFKEIATPILEPCELYTRSLGTETDVVNKEMYKVQSDLDNTNQDLICLRPEGTASTVRAFVNNSINLTPWKVFSWGPMFRHERPQKGRYRQFHQINIEVIGSKSINQDVQVIKMLDRLFSEKLNLDTYALLINFLGCSEDRVKFKQKLYNFLLTLENKTGDNKTSNNQICENCKVRKESNIMRIFDCKNRSCQSLYENAPKITDILCSECKQEWTDLKDNLEHLSVSYSHNPKLVRGLDYYGKTVFEFISQDLGSQSAFCGGGRYDQLAKEIGAKEDYPSIGAAIGIERALLLLESSKNKLKLPETEPLNIILPLTKEQQPLALLIADELQSNNLRTDTFLEQDSIKSMMRKANKLGAKFVILVGQEEQKNKEVTLKNMITGEEEEVAQNDLVQYLKQLK